MLIFPNERMNIQSSANFISPTPPPPPPRYEYTSYTVYKPPLLRPVIPVVRGISSQGLRHLIPFRFHR